MAGCNSGTGARKAGTDGARHPGVAWHSAASAVGIGHKSWCMTCCLNVASLAKTNKDRAGSWVLENRKTSETELGKKYGGMCGPHGNTTARGGHEPTGGICDQPITPAAAAAAAWQLRIRPTSLVVADGVHNRLSQVLALGLAEASQGEAPVAGHVYVVLVRLRRWG